jgi:hypothetical protein
MTQLEKSSWLDPVKHIPARIVTGSGIRKSQVVMQLLIWDATALKLLGTSSVKMSALHKLCASGACRAILLDDIS